MEDGQYGMSPPAPAPAPRFQSLTPNSTGKSLVLRSEQIRPSRLRRSLRRLDAMARLSMHVSLREIPSTFKIRKRSSCGKLAIINAGE